MNAIPAPPRAGRVRAYLQLMRPANIVTALADILAGFGASGAAVYLLEAGDAFSLLVLGWLLLATVGLYGGGVVFNDVFDAALDTRERPERPIPSGRASRRGAALLGGALLLLGVWAASRVSMLSAALALAVACCALLYDAYGKHRPVFGPLNMGACRGGNLLLGVSAVPPVVADRWYLALLPVAYIAAITAISRGEVHGGNRRTGVLALALVGGVIAGLLALDVLPGYQALQALPFLLVFAGLVGPPFVRAARTPQPDLIRRAVKAGVLSLILLDAALAAGFVDWRFGLLVAVLLPVSMGLARLFAVT